MRIFARLFLVILLAYVGIDAYCYAGVSYIDNDFSGDSLSISNDTIITDNATIDIDNLNIYETLFLGNNGEINANINICSGCHLYFKNSGYFSGTFNFGNGAALTQVISAASDMTQMPIVGGFDVLVYNANLMSLKDVINIGAGANKIILNNSSFVLDDLISDRVMKNAAPEIELVGNIEIYLDSVSNINGNAILYNVTGSEKVIFHVKDADSLFAINSYIDSGKLYLSVKRETDYAKILNNNIGVFINSLRNENPNHRLLGALDNVANMGDLYSAMGKSVNLHPINLLKPIRIFNNFEMFANTDIYDDLFVGAEPIYIISSDFNLYAALLKFGAIKFSNWKLSMSAYAGELEYTDDINEFSGMFYGGNIRAGYDDGDIVVRNTAGLTIGNFNAGRVFDGNLGTENPRFSSVYFASDFGTRISMAENLFVIPFVGVTGDCAKILRETDIDFYADIGMDISFATTGYDVNYNYVLRTIINTAGAIDASLNIGFWSETDNAGGKFSASIINNEIGVSYKLSVSANYMF